MHTISMLRLAYKKATEHLSAEEIRIVESGGHCTSRSMCYAQACYQRLKAAEYAEANPSDNAPEHQME